MANITKHGVKRLNRAVSDFLDGASISTKISGIPVLRLEFASKEQMYEVHMGIVESLKVVDMRLDGKLPYTYVGDNMIRYEPLNGVRFELTCLDGDGLHVAKRGRAEWASLASKIGKVREKRNG